MRAGQGQYFSRLQLYHAGSFVVPGTERDMVRDGARKKAAERRPDPLLRESASILADAVNLLENVRPLSAQVLPQSTGAGRWAD